MSAAQLCKSAQGPVLAEMCRALAPQMNNEQLVVLAVKQLNSGEIR
jgi:hypothetical protein